MHKVQPVLHHVSGKVSNDLGGSTDNASKVYLFR